MRNIEDNTHFIFPPSLQVGDKEEVKSLPSLRPRSIDL